MSNHNEEVDEEFIPGKDKEPKVVACVACPDKLAVKNFNIKGDFKYGGVLFGLCQSCLDTKNNYDFITQTINHRLKNLSDKKEKPK